MAVAIKLLKWQAIELHWNKEVNNFNDLWWPWPLRLGHETYIMSLLDSSSNISQNMKGIGAAVKQLKRHEQTHRHTHTHTHRQTEVLMLL